VNALKYAIIDPEITKKKSLGALFPDPSLKGDTTSLYQPPSTIDRDFGAQPGPQIQILDPPL